MTSTIDEKVSELSMAIHAVREEVKELREAIDECPHCDCGHKMKEIEVLNRHIDSMMLLRNEIALSESL
jgi:hypothetical protein